MKVNPYASLKPYAADGHIAMHCLRAQGHEASPASTSWMGISWLLPGGHTTLNASPVEKMYLVLEGEVVVGNGGPHEGDEATLHRHDSCYFAPGEQRQLRNASQRPAAILLVMPYPPAPP